ncbi:hypothetical protein Metme_0537 [Methylomonas methanica MC09]|uniref:Uncharacterized protein n=1 Tax=Methylomonas methanica (strain DSM 25384 / MC09) TaxID=857087 RepID=G0A349_METMM|nr:hypothetical protein Metme_0537 [Methylomonas methanica MC09]
MGDIKKEATGNLAGWSVVEKGAADHAEPLAYCKVHQPG